jgi:hypothetical protein
MLSHIEAPSQEVVEVAFRTIARWLELTTPRSWHFDDLRWLVEALTTRRPRVSWQKRAQSAAVYRA